MTNVPDDQAPLEPGDDELHPELKDIVTIRTAFIPPDEVDQQPDDAEIEVPS